MSADIESRIRKRAHELWEQEGRPEGRDKEHWERAEAEIRAAEKGGGKAAKGTKAAAPKRAAAKPAAAKKPAAKKAASPRKKAAAAKPA